MDSLDAYRAQWARLDERDAGGGSGWLRPLRRRAMDSFLATGFPNRTEENWKYTNVSPIAKSVFSAGAKHEGDVMRVRLFAQAHSFAPAHRWVFINGRYSPELSAPGDLPQGVVAQPLSDALTARRESVEAAIAADRGSHANPFVNLNSALLEDGLFVEVPEGIELDRPIHVLFLSTTHGEPSHSNPRNIYHLHRHARAVIAESYVGHGDDVYFTNSVTDATLDHHAALEHVKLQRESLKAYHVASFRVDSGRDARFTSHSISLGGSLVRNDLGVAFSGEGSECVLRGLYMAAGRQHVDNHTVIDHARPQCRSAENYKGVLDGFSRGVFNGKVIVRPDAQKSDASQSNRNLLLSDTAVVDTKPQLEILADDVKCTHGAAVGQLDEDALFYLRARGIGLESARSVLTYAFADEILRGIGVKSVREQLERFVADRLPAAGLLREAA